MRSELPTRPHRTISRRPPIAPKTLSLILDCRFLEIAHVHTILAASPTTSRMTKPMTPNIPMFCVSGELQSSMFLISNQSAQSSERSPSHSRAPRAKIGTVSEYPHHKTTRTTESSLRIFADRHHFSLPSTPNKASLGPLRIFRPTATPIRTAPSFLSSRATCKMQNQHKAL